MDTPTLAIVVPCYNEQAALPETCRRLTRQLIEMRDGDLISPQSFICLVDDGSVDRSWETIARMSESDRAIRGVKLSRNFGHQPALLAGLVTVKDRCDCVITIDADLQQDETAMPRFIDKFRGGHDVVFGVRKDRSADGIFKRTTAGGFYKLMSWMGVRIIPNHADYRLLSRKALGALLEFGEGNLFLRGLVTQLGFRSAQVTFDVRPRAAGTTKYSVIKMFAFAFNGITSFSVAPLRMIAFLGALFTVLSLTMATYVIFSKIFFESAVPGWASTVLPIYILGGIQLFAIGIIGEYIGRIYLETKRRPRFIIETDLSA